MSRRHFQFEIKFRHAEGATVTPFDSLDPDRFFYHYEALAECVCIWLAGVNNPSFGNGTFFVEPISRHAWGFL